MIQLVCGPAASGKTSFVLNKIRERLTATSPRFRLLVPTATTAEHFRHVLARDSFVFSPESVTTLARFVESRSADRPMASAALLDHVLRTLLPELRISTFDAVRHYAGFRDRLRGLMDEFATTKLDASRLAVACEKASLTSAEIRGFLRVYARVEQELQTRNLCLRGEKIAATTAAIQRYGIDAVNEVLLDGFYAFSTPERELILELARHASVTLTLPDSWPEARAAREFFLAQGATETRLTASAGAASVAKVVANSREQECEEIARRIVALRAEGSLLREIGVIIRSELPYRPILESTFERFGVPARFYFSTNLEQQAPVRFLSAVIDALLSGWDRRKVVELVRFSASGLGGMAAGDRIEHELLDKIPGFGIEGAGSLEQTLEPLESWRDARRKPAQWADALSLLRRIVHPVRHIQPGSHQEAQRWRVQAEALAAWQQALIGTADALGTPRLSLEEFWMEAREAIRLTPFRVRDGRRDVVHVMDVFESRQWRLKAVFVCGLLEGEFPQFAAPPPIIGDGPRHALRAQGMDLRTSADRQAEEDLLIDLAISRADTNVVLTWPRFNSKGEETLPSFALERFVASKETARSCRPRPKRDFMPAASAVRIPAEFLPERFGPGKKWSPSEIERFLKCPFLYFGERTLRLAETPKAPADRFSVREHGSLSHAVLRILHERSADSMDQIFDETFREICRSLHVVENHRVEWDRLALLRNLRAFLQEAPPNIGWKTQVEWEFEFPLIEGLMIRGRIDRFDESAEGDVIATDYKYSNSQRTRALMQSEEAVQGGLYLLALKHSGRRPIGFVYVPLRGESKPARADNPEELMTQARERTLDATARILQGEIAVAPSDPDTCRWCALRGVCRIATQTQAIAATNDLAEGSEWS